MKSVLRIEPNRVELLESYPKCKKENREGRLDPFLPEVQWEQHKGYQGIHIRI
jgi:hypothetical protein